MSAMPSPYLLLFFFFLFFICISLSATAEEKASISTCPASAAFTPRIVPSKEQAQLKVLVPNITLGSLRQLVDCSDPSHVRGFCIDVFETALSFLSPNYSSASISYTCFNFSLIPNTINKTLTYTDMIHAVANGSYDVVVGDVTIAAQRAYDLDFTHQYMESGVVIITKATNEDRGSDWTFFGSPFTWRMWSMVVGAFVASGFLLWLLEHESDPELREGSITKRLHRVFWFITEALVLLQRESIKSTAGQLVMVAWVFVVLLLASSYTAGLSSILTASNLSAPTNDILTIKESNKSIAYRRGSITKDFLITRFHVREAQLKPIRATVDFVNNITKGPSSGGVIAIIDELPYANIMLANLSCDYAITGPQLTSEGFGFGFRQGLQNWVKEFSIALLNLTESGCLQEIQNNRSINTANKCSPIESQSKKISWKSLFPLFFILISIAYLCVITSYIIKKKKQNVNITTGRVVDDQSILNHSEPLQGSTLELSTFS